jgi:hypothetical protein
LLFDAGHEAVWTKDSMAGMEELTRGQVLQAQVCGYAEDGLPAAYLYAIHGSQVRFLKGHIQHISFHILNLLFCNC